MLTEEALTFQSTGIFVVLMIREKILIRLGYVMYSIMYAVENS